MTDKAELLKQLRIERDERPTEPGHGGKKRWIVVLIIVLAALVAIAFVFFRRAAPTVRVAVARASATSGADRSRSPYCRAKPPASKSGSRKPVR